MRGAVAKPDYDRIERHVTVRPSDVVFVKGIVEASRGIATLHADAGGELVLVTTPSLVDELDRLIDDLVDEIGLRRRAGPLGGLAGGSGGAAG
ncbi:MAG: DUF4911 domain-containing protein [Deltaproteobacteria bacterium]|jgi:hypothetical protein|nr:DUF4911 domain-containing protein [Deltaproteobacteria bacterium]MBW2533309.1 DUF4911 domain-containing protein [Deltaproteobacteria bacterium]